jgi:hypothetical protein
VRVKVKDDGEERVVDVGEGGWSMHSLLVWVGGGGPGEEKSLKMFLKEFFLLWAIISCWEEWDSWSDVALAESDMKEQEGGNVFDLEGPAVGEGGGEELVSVTPLELFRKLSKKWRAKLGESGEVDSLRSGKICTSLEIKSSSSTGHGMRVNGGGMGEGDFFFNVRPCTGEGDDRDRGGETVGHVFSLRGTATAAAVTKDNGKTRDFLLKASTSLHPPQKSVVGAEQESFWPSSSQPPPPHPPTTTREVERDFLNDLGTGW